MKASRFSDAQKAFILKQGADGMPVADICRKAGISQATYFNWKKKYDGLLPTEMRRLKRLEDENGKLRKVVADLSLDKEMLQAPLGDIGDTGAGRTAPRPIVSRLGPQLAGLGSPAGGIEDRCGSHTKAAEPTQSASVERQDQCPTGRRSDTADTAEDDWRILIPAPGPDWHQATERVQREHQQFNVV
jgi:putative transposase